MDAQSPSQASGGGTRDVEQVVDAQRPTKRDQLAEWDDRRFGRPDPGSARSPWLTTWNSIRWTSVSSSIGPARTSLRSSRLK
jgi:hypothetical protein